MSKRSTTGSQSPMLPQGSGDAPMEPDSWRQLKQIYAASRHLAAEERKAYLDQHCANNDSLRNDVEALLASDQSDLKNATISSAIGQTAAELFSGNASEGDTFGAYRIVRELGRGGMGTVWLAKRDDDQYQSSVAIKVMHGLSGNDVRDRFLTERQLLANLNHLNISRLLDGGTTESGVPYVVMEYVEGVPIDTYCNEQKLSLTERIRLFCTVCDAVQYAHRNLIVHRDIKPENILVTKDRIPKLLDFGIAKMLDGGRSQNAAHTLHAQSMLTPMYASPEQVLGQPVTTTSDVYALGVLLYRLLTDASPYAVDSDDLFKVAQAICEKEPIKPSSRNPRLRGDLDTILSKALRKEPESRYASADELSEDLVRHLERLPVRARPATSVYRLSRFISRNTSAVVLSSVAIAGLISATVFSWHQMQEAVQARNSAEYERSVAVNEILRTTLLSAKEAIDADDVVSARRLLERIQPSERGWEWSVLASQLDQSIVTLKEADTVAAGLWGDAALLTVSAKGDVTWWQGSVAQRRTSAPGGIVSQAAVSQDGSFIVMARGTNRLELWKILAPGELEMIFDRAFEGSAKDLALSLDGQQIALITNAELFLWNTRRSTDSRHRMPLPARKVIVSADGRRVGVLFDSKPNATSGNEAYRIYEHSGDIVTQTDAYDVFSLTLSTDGSRAATSEAESTIRLRETSTTRVLDRFIGHRQPPDQTLFSADGHWLVSGSKDGTVRFWSTDGSETTHTQRGVDEDMEALQTDRTGRFAAALWPDGQVKLWDAQETNQTPERSGRWAFVHPNGTEIYTLDSFGLLRRYDAVTLRLFDQKPVGTLAATSFALSADGGTLAVGERGALLFIDATDLTEIRSISLDDSAVIAVSFSVDGTRVVALQANGMLTAIETHTGSTQIIGTHTPAESGALAYNPDGTAFASAMHSQLVLWDARSLKPLNRYTHNNAHVLSVAFSHSGEHMASGWDDGAVRLSRTEKLQEQIEFSERTSSVRAVAFSPDDALIASGSSDAEVWLWNTRTQRPLLSVNQSRNAPVDSLRFSPDGRQLIAGFLNNRIRHWSNHTTQERWQWSRQQLAQEKLMRERVRTAFNADRHIDRVATQLRRDDTLTLPQRKAALTAALSPPTVPLDLSGDPFNGYALVFNGGDDHVLAAHPDGLVMQETFTVESWVKPYPFDSHDTPLSLRMLLNKEGEYQIAIRPDGSLHWTLSSERGWMGWVPTQYTLNHGEWAHIAFVREPRTMRVYVNGELIQRQSVPSTIGDEHRFKNEFRIGGRQHTPSSFYGLLDEVRVWETARTQEQIQSTMMQMVTADEPGLLASWSFDEGSGGSTRELREAHSGDVVGALWHKTQRP